MNIDEKYMRRCLQLAASGRGFTAPNPMVGAVIVHDGKIIGEGFHRKYKTPHAEVNAIAAVKNAELLKNSTLYVNLEPCSHHGNTPPCAELIIRKKIPRVAVGLIDPFPEVAGRGVKMLQDAGVEVVCGILEDKCRRFNRRFLTFTEKHRPYIILKWAQSADGFIDRIREEGDGQKPVRISGDFAKTIVHKHRAEESAIMIGRRTLLLDRPKLDVRYWDGQNPRKYVADSSLTLEEQLDEMYRDKIQSLIVEGGTKLLTSFIERGLWDEANVETANIFLKSGVKAPDLHGDITEVQNLTNSVILQYQNPDVIAPPI